MPALNEEEALPFSLAEAVDALAEVAETWELIVVDDGSRDSTPLILSRWAARDERIRVLTQRPSQGYSRAMARGFDASRYLTVLATDADGQFDLRQALELYPHLQRAEMVAGFRLGRREGWRRRLGSWGYNRLVGLLLGLEVRDVNCSMKLIRQSALQLARLESDGFLVDAELYLRLREAGLRWVQVGVEHRPRRHGVSTVGLGHVLPTLRGLWRLRRSMA